jgi:hypothetical protein
VAIVAAPNRMAAATAIVVLCMKISPTAALVRPSIHNTGATGLVASLRCDDAGEVIVLFDPIVLRHASIQAREVLRARGLRQGEDERYAVADHVVGQLKERGDPWRLDDEAKIGSGPTT